MHQAAKILRVYRKDKPNRIFGRNTLINKLRENSILMKEENIPYQTFIQSEDFIIVKKVIEHKSGIKENVFASKFTEKGIVRLKQFFINNKYTFRDEAK